MYKISADGSSMVADTNTNKSGTYLYIFLEAKLLSTSPNLYVIVTFLSLFLFYLINFKNLYSIELNLS